jgi:hypothetical protein
MSYAIEAVIFKLKKYTIEDIIITLLLIAGVALSLSQFLYNRSLWVDEAMLTLNIIEKNNIELLSPLDFNQVAPILFLQIEKLFSTLLPNTEYGLRLFPLLCFWAAGYFFYKIIKKQLHSGYEIILALSFFVLNREFIAYSSEVKQYMTDVFVLLTIFYLLMKNYRKEKTQYYVLGIAGAVSIFLSNVAPIILFTAGIYLFYTDFFVLKRKRILPLFIVFAVWLGIFGMYYYYFIYEHPSQEFMVGYWLPSAFLPHNSWGEFWKFITLKRAVLLGALFYRNGVVQPFEPIVQLIFLLTFLAGMLSLILKKRTGIIILTCTPLVLHVFLSAFQLYPFDLRLVLYILPGIIIICSIGFIFILKFVFNWLKIEKYPTGKYNFFILLFPILLFLNGYPVKIKKQEIKECIRYIQENCEANEKIYAHASAIPASKYYVAIGFAPPIEYIDPSLYKRISAEEYLNRLKTVHGKHWLLYEPLHSDKSIWWTDETMEKIDSCYKKLKTFETAGSAVSLYDFGE